MPDEVFRLWPPFCLPRPGLILQRARKLRSFNTDTGTEILKDALGEFGLKALGPFKKLEGAVRNETWTVETPAGKKVLKRYKRSLTSKQIAYEHSILDHLKELDFPSVRLAHSKDGETVIQHEGRFYAVIDYLEGYIQFYNYIPLPGQNAQFLAAEGRTLGLLHRALEGFTPEGISRFGQSLDGYGMSMSTEWYLERLDKALEMAREKPALVEHPISREVIRRAGWVRERLGELNQYLKVEAAQNLGIIHGDYGPHNLLFRPGCPVVVLDFELSRLDWRLVDLTTALSRSTDPGHPANDSPGIRPILSAYQAVYQGDEASLKLLPDVWLFQVLRRLIVTWSEYMETGDPVRLNEARRRLERMDWLLRHREPLSMAGELAKKPKIALDTTP